MGDLVSPVFRICYNFRIVGGQRLSRGRDVEGAVPYMVCENINVVGNNTHC